MGCNTHGALIRGSVACTRETILQSAKHYTPFNYYNTNFLKQDNNNSALFALTTKIHIYIASDENYSNLKCL